MITPPHPGDALPPWTPGLLDIHHISTGLGVATFGLLPDGTTLLIDAGELDRTAPRTHSQRNTPPRPNASRLAHEWIAHYIRHMLPHQPAPELDYAVITHFHDDHMGVVTDLAPQSPTGAYRQSGITGLGDLIPIHTLLDRGYPDYNHPFALDDPFIQTWLAGKPGLQRMWPQFVRQMAHYRAFIEWQKTHAGMRVERARAGRDDQIVPQHDRDTYDVQVRTICANGEVWTGSGSEAHSDIPPIPELVRQGRIPDENLCSIGLCIRYGAFVYWNGADIPGIVELDLPEWYDLETPVSKVVGPVDVHVLNHHGYRNTQNEAYVRALRPRVMINPVWSADQPGHGVLKRLTSTYLYPGPRDLFATDMLDAKRIVLGDLIDRTFKSQHGHVIVRVEPQGKQYWVIVLDDTDESCPVKSVHGVYKVQNGPPR